MTTRRSAGIATLATLALVAAACSSGSTGTSPTTTAASASSAVTTTTAAGLPDGITVRPGVEQIAVLGARPGDQVTVVSPHIGTKDVRQADAQGSVLFRNLLPAAGWRVQVGGAMSSPLTVMRADDPPPAGLYTSQTLLPAGGFGYITTRDGTTLSANVIFPGPATKGPYPTVVEYSGYQPSDPASAQLASLYTSEGFAYVGVNMRGTGCSGGSYRFFESAQSVDGYDVIEAVAAQPWVMGHKVGMVGISYPGISQLFVAATQPPSLEAITPLSVIDDSFRSTLYPGGILNTGFAVDWTKARMDQSKMYGEAWTKKRADGGDTRCAANQQLRLQNPDLVKEIEDNPYYSNPLGDSLAPDTFVDKIKVPVFIAGAWQDEQTGGHFATMLPLFTGSPHVYATLVNGLHTESISPPVLQRGLEFLQLYVGKKVPDLTPVDKLLPVLGGAIWGVGKFPAFAERFTGKSYQQALSEFEAEQPIQVLFEQGGSAAYTPGTPEPNFTASFPSWPIPGAGYRRWELGAAGALVPEPDDGYISAGQDAYTAQPMAPATFYSGDGNGVWKANVHYDWRAIPAGTGLGFVTAPLGADTVVVGSGSVDLWLKSSAADTDLEVTISEVRPDGTEIYVQSGWLRASQRALDTTRSTAERPVQTHLEEDKASVPADHFVLARVELFPFAHPFRAGSRIRLTIHAPGNDRAVWSFRTISNGETVTIAHDADHPSQLVLAVVPGVAITAPAPPPCGALRGEPCRPFVAAANGG